MEPPSSQQEGSPPRFAPGHGQSFIEQWMPWLVALAAAGCAAYLYARFLQSPRLLYDDAIHDRNTHLYSGLCLAMDARLGDFRHLFPDLDSFRTWPPLQGVLVGAALLLGGGDERVAVLPSLGAWAGAGLFAFLLARRCSARCGTVAGLVAALFVLVSPAQRAYATDVMIESLGACLSVACLYFYVTAIQDRTPPSYRRLALSLTLLFFTKYNYWLLVVLGMLADRAAADPGKPIAWARNRLNSLAESRWLDGQLRRPANYAVLLVVAIAILLTISGGVSFRLFGKSVFVGPSPNLVTIVYAACYFRLIPWYRRAGRVMIDSAGEAVRALAAWHILPMAFWFLWPHRLYSFLWVIDPASNAGEHPRHDLIGGYVFYWSSISHDYHIAAWSAAFAVGLFLIAAWAGLRGWLRPGAAAILWLVAIAFVLTVHHQNRKSRFLHSWIPMVWVGAGIGAGALAPGRSKGKALAARTGGLAAVCAFAVAHLPGLAASAHAPEGGIHPSAHSTLDITDAYLPALADSRQVAVFSNLPMKYLAQWTYLRRYGRTRRLDTDIKGFNPALSDNRSCLDAWVGTTDCDTIVYVDFLRSSPFMRNVPGCEYLAQYRNMMEEQKRFSPFRRYTLPRYGCTVTVWKRSGSYQGAGG